MSSTQAPQPSQTPQTSPGRMKPSTAVYWFRVFLAIITGFANQLLHVDQASLGDVAVFVGIGLGVIFYLISILVVRYGFHYGEADLKGKNRYITLGGGSFIVLWITVSVLLNTLRLFG